jgi:transcription antitermination factor NusG
MNERSVLSVVTTFGVHYIVGFGSTLKPLAEHEAKAVEALCEPKVKSEPCEIYTVGKKVVITQGYFCGLTGTLQNVKDQTKVIISIDSLQIAFRVTLSPCAFTIF